MRVNQPASPHVAEDAIYDGTPTGRRPQDSRVHYRGGKRIDTTQASPKPVDDIMDEIRKIIREEVKGTVDPSVIRGFVHEEIERYIGQPKDWRGRKGAT